MAYAHDEAVIATPIGAVRIVGEDDRIDRVTIGEDSTARGGDAPAVREAARQISAYLAGDSFAFDLPLAPARSLRGEALRAGIAAIGYGETLSYGTLARLLASGPRAIGQACARNPFPIVIPCHRVIGGGGSLGHYSGGRGLETKQALLDLEARQSGRARWAA